MARNEEHQPLQAEADNPPTGIYLRTPCKCGWIYGKIHPKGGQNCVYCTECDAFQYNAPKVETGQKKRSISTIRNQPKPKQRSRILSLDSYRCGLCHATDKPLQIGHIVSVKDCLSLRWRVKQINSDDNLFAICEECNLGESSQSLPKEIADRILSSRKVTG